MNSIALKTHTDVDGRLRLDIPTGLIDTDLEVIVIMQPVTNEPVTNTEYLGCPPGFFEKTFGSFKDEPLEAETDETAYLLQNPANRKRLLEAIENVAQK